MNLFHTILAITGQSGSGKTTLAEKLCRELVRRGFQPAFAKHSSHRHFFDAPGKDTGRLFEAGAGWTSIGSDQTRMTHVHQGYAAESWPLFPACDLVIQEGFRDFEGPQIRCLKEGEAVPPGQIIALQCPTLPPDAASSVPAFAWDAPIAEMAEQVLADLAQFYQQQRPLRVALMAGGQSTRMGQDKALLDYGRGPQLEALAAVVRQVLPQAPLHLSQRPGQGLTLDGATLVEDRFLGVGPLGGLLSLFHAHPETAWLVLAVDLATLQAEPLTSLIQGRNPLKLASVLATERLEPLAAIYEPSIQPWLRHALFSGQHGLTRLLESLPIQTLPVTGGLFNANHPEDLEQARRYWGS